MISWDTVHPTLRDALLDVMKQLGITVSEKKLVAPTTRAVCLGILIDTVDGTVAIPPEKLQDIKNMVKQWKGKKYCTKRELQSLLGTLLYIHKCVKSARCFLNRMLETLRKASNPAKTGFTNDFWAGLTNFYHITTVSPCMLTNSQDQFWNLTPA